MLPKKVQGVLSASRMKLISSAMGRCHRTKEHHAANSSHHTGFYLQAWGAEWGGRGRMDSIFPLVLESLA